MAEIIQIGTIIIYNGRKARVEDIIDGRNYKNGKPRVSLQYLDGHDGAYAQLDGLKRRAQLAEQQEGR